MMHAVRQLGNIAAHPKAKAGEILDVEPDELELMIETLEAMFDYYYILCAPQT